MFFCEKLSEAAAEDRDLLGARGARPPRSPSCSAPAPGRSRRGGARSRAAPPRGRPSAAPIWATRTLWPRWIGSPAQTSMSISASLSRWRPGAARSAGRRAARLRRSSRSGEARLDSSYPVLAPAHQTASGSSLTSPAVPSGFEVDQVGAVRHLIADSIAEGFESPARRADGVLHLHRFHDEQAARPSRPDPARPAAR